MRRFDPTQIGWKIGRAWEPRAGELWCPWDRTAGVIGPQGSGKTLDLLTPALLAAPGAALVTLTKVDDLLLTITDRSTDDRPCAVLDPFGLAPGLPELVWDPVQGCVDPMVAERRAKAFTAGTIRGAIHTGSGDSAARFYASEAAKVLQGYLHAAALTGRTLDDVLDWVSRPLSTTEPGEILREHPHAAPYWHGLLHGALHGDDRTSSNTVTTVHQALNLFFQADIRRRCVPSAVRAATDIADIIRRRGTIYLLGREDPYASASPLMTALAEHVLDTALALANTSPGDASALRCSPHWMSCRRPLRCRRCAHGWRTSAPWGSRSSTPPKPGGSSRRSSATRKPRPCSASPTCSSCSAAARTSRSTRKSPTSSAPSASPVPRGKPDAAAGRSRGRTSPSCAARKSDNSPNGKPSSSPRTANQSSPNSPAASTAHQDAPSSSANEPRVSAWPLHATARCRLTRAPPQPSSQPSAAASPMAGGHRDQLGATFD